MHFWSGSTVKASEIQDIKAYNRANGWLWLTYTVLQILAGVISLFDEIVGVILFGVIIFPGILVLVLIYQKIYKKYKAKEGLNAKGKCYNTTIVLSLIENLGKGLKKMKTIDKLFITLEALCYLLILFVVNGKLGVGLRYLSILMCFIYVMMHASSKEHKLLSLAFLLTLIADLFLLIIADYYAIGVGVFIFVQVIYSYRLNARNEKARYIYEAIALGIIINELLAWGFLKDSFDLVVFLTLFYFTLLLSNVFISFTQFKKRPVFALGLLLFLFCDIAVGLSNFSDYEISSKLVQTILELPLDLAWFFYIPSQVCIALSIKKAQSN